MSEVMRVDLNADLGEGLGPWRMGDDEAMLAIVSSANIACGFHAGDPLGIRRTLRRAREKGVAVGAHPGYPDLVGFGRRRLEMSSDELEAALIYQIGALQALARSEGVRVGHVKPHGALSNVACVEPVVAATVVRAIHAVDASLILLAPALSALAAAGEAAGVRVVQEVFADRAYGDDGQLLPRSLPGAVLESADACLAHVQAMLAHGAITSVSGKRLPVRIESICVHGDSPHAVATARALAAALVAAGFEVAAFAGSLASG